MLPIFTPSRSFLWPKTKLWCNIDCLTNWNRFYRIASILRRWHLWDRRSNYGHRCLLASLHSHEYQKCIQAFWIIGKVVDMRKTEIKPLLEACKTIHNKVFDICIMLWWCLQQFKQCSWKFEIENDIVFRVFYMDGFCLPPFFQPMKTPYKYIAECGFLVTSTTWTSNATLFKHSLIENTDQNCDV